MNADREKEIRQRLAMIRTSRDAGCDEEAREYERNLAADFAAERALRQQAEHERDELSDALTEDCEKWSFETLLFIAERLLAEQYGEDVFPRDKPLDEGDPGPRLVRALRLAVEDCRAALGVAETKHECQRCGSDEWTDVDYSGCSECREPAETKQEPPR